MDTASAPDGSIVGCHGWYICTGDGGTDGFVPTKQFRRAYLMRMNNKADDTPSPEGLF
jgi:hypothetical protein